MARISSSFWQPIGAVTRVCEGRAEESGGALKGGTNPATDLRTPEMSCGWTVAGEEGPLVLMNH